MHSCFDNSRKIRNVCIFKSLEYCDEVTTKYTGPVPKKKMKSIRYLINFLRYLPQKDIFAKAN